MGRILISAKSELLRCSRCGKRLTSSRHKNKARCFACYVYERGGRIWTADELNRLKDLYPRSTVKEVASALGHPESGVVDKANQLGLYSRKRTQEMLQIRTYTSLSERELGYIAGIIDGEAYIGIRRTGASVTIGIYYYCCDIEVKNTDLRMIHFLHDKCGGSTKTERRATKRGKEVSAWLLQGASAENLLSAVYDCLVCKREQADLVFRFRATFANHFAYIPVEIAAIRDACYLKMRELHANYSHKGDWLTKAFYEF